MSQFITAPKAAERVGLCYRHFIVLVREGRGPTPVGRAALRGRPLLFSAEEVDRWDTERRGPVLPAGKVGGQ